MNHSICSADRATHVKIVAMALFLGTVVTGISLFLHSYPKVPSVERMAVLKARAPMAANAIIVVVR
jgi:hypothetical protein